MAVGAGRENGHGNRPARHVALGRMDDRLFPFGSTRQRSCAGDAEQRVALIVGDRLVTLSLDRERKGQSGKFAAVVKPHHRAETGYIVTAFDGLTMAKRAGTDADFARRAITGISGDRYLRVRSRFAVQRRGQPVAHRFDPPRDLVRQSRQFRCDFRETVAVGRCPHAEDSV